MARFALATDAVDSVLATMNEHTFVNIVLLESEVGRGRSANEAMSPPVGCPDAPPVEPPWIPRKLTAMLLVFCQKAKQGDDYAW